MCTSSENFTYQMDDLFSKIMGSFEIDWDIGFLDFSANSFMNAY